MLFSSKQDICLIMSQRVSLLCILQLVFPGVSQWHMWHNVTTSVPFVYPHIGVPSFVFRPGVERHMSHNVSTSVPFVYPQACVPQCPPMLPTLWHPRHSNTFVQHLPNTLVRVDLCSSTLSLETTTSVMSLWLFCQITTLFSLQW